MQEHLAAAQWYFPHYKVDLDHEEIALREYDLSAKALESDHKSLTAAAGVLLFFTGAVTTFVGSSGGVKTFSTISQQVGPGVEIGLLIAGAVIALLLMHYFAGLQRSATYASRKIVVLRRLLGLDYGNIQTVLPSDRLDGANEPFSVPMFPGWTSLTSLPAIAIALITASYAFAVVASIGIWDATSAVTSIHRFDGLSPLQTGGAWGATFFAGLLIFYRWSLLDDFETFRLREAVAVGRLLGSPLKTRPGHVLYRLRLSVFEAERLGFRLESFFKLLIHIEDRKFYDHNGNSFGDLVKAVGRYIKYRKMFGASTIYQQLARSNFLTSFGQPIRRKLLEWSLAPWLNGQFTKEDGLKAYICSVRYARGVFGLPAAVKYFFPRKRSRKLSKAQIFVLIERLSNVSATYPESRVRALLTGAKNANLLSANDEREALAIYDGLIAARKIRRI